MDTGLDKLISWEGAAIGLLDLDAFFASVEQLDHPEWRGKPVIVGGDANNRGVVSTASYEARTFGVHSAMPSALARRLCPNAIWTRGNFARYREMSAKVMAIILDETPLVEQVSIDEAFFDVTPGRYSKESPLSICRRIQDRVSKLGVSASIGLSTSKTVAKIASEQEKPRGLTVVPPGTERSFLAPLPVSALSGIGKATQSTLSDLGITSLGQLASADPSNLERIFGVSGPRMVARAQGQELSPVRAAADHEDPKSVSKEHTFSQDLTTEVQLRAAIGSLSEQVGTRLRKKGLKGYTVTLKLKFDVHRTHTAQQQLTRATDDEHVFGPVALGLLDSLWRPGTPVRLVGVGISGFDARPEQLSLIPEEGESTRDLRALSEVTDRLRERFGTDAVRYGRDLRL